MSYTFPKQAPNSNFAGGNIVAKTVKPGYEERISFVKEGKERWHSLIPTVHGRDGGLREHRYFPFSNEHLLIASDYEHYRGGHTNSMITVCNPRGICCTAHIDPLLPLVVDKSGTRDHALLTLETMHVSTVQPENEDYLLGYRLRVFGLGKNAIRQSIPLRAPRLKVCEIFGLSTEELDQREWWRFPFRFGENKSGATYIQIRSPFPDRSNGKFQFDLDELRYDAPDP